MTALDDVRRSRTITMLAASACAVLVAIGLAYVGLKASVDYKGASKVESNTLPIPATPVGLLATVDDQNRLGSLTLMVLNPATDAGVAGGSVVNIPISADSTLGFGDARVPFSEAYASEGVEGLLFAVESALAITLDVSLVANTAEASALFAPLGDVAVMLPAAVGPTAVGDTFAAGANTLTTGQLVAVLNQRVEGQPETSRIPTLQAVWEGVSARVAGGTTIAVSPVVSATTAQPSNVAPDASSTTVAADPSVTTVAAPATIATLPPPAPAVTVASAPLSSLADLFAHLVAGPVGVRSLSTEPLTAGTSAGQQDVVKLDRSDAVLVLASIAPRSMSSAAAGLTYRIEAPPGYEAQVMAVIDYIIVYGGNVKSVYLNGPTQPETIFLVADSRVEEQAKASKTDSAFKLVRFDEPETPIEDIDVILQLGTDFLAATTGAIQIETSTTVGDGASTTLPVDMSTTTISG